MTGDYSLLSNFVKKGGGKVTFGDNSKGNILGYGSVGNSSSPTIENVQLVDNLKHNLLSISQLCDKGYVVKFDSSCCKIKDIVSSKIAFKGSRNENVYTIDIEHNHHEEKCLASLKNDSWLWHRRLGHASMDLLSRISKNAYVKGLSNVSFEKDKICEPCQLEKQVRTTFKSKQHFSSSKPLQLVHMDLFGPSRTASLGGKHYAFVIVDDFSRFTWVMFLKFKDEALKVFENFCKRVENEKGYTITSIRSDHGGEFDSDSFEIFCNSNGYDHNFSAPRTPQQNGVVERKNRTLQEMARTMLSENNLPKYFWAEAVSTACYVNNRVYVARKKTKTPYELWKNRIPNIAYFRVFGCKCFILNTKDNLGKFDAKADVGIFLGYSNTSKAYRVFNKRTLVVEESIHVTFDESNPLDQGKGVYGDDIVDLDIPLEQLTLRTDKETTTQKEKEVQEDQETEQEEDQEEITQPENIKDPSLPKEWRYNLNHPKELILGDPSKGVSTRTSLRNICNNMAFISQVEPKNFKEAELDDYWILAMQEELNQFERSDV